MIRIEHGDCISAMAEMPSGTVQCAVTSPPYYGLRDYGVDGQIGLEKSPDEYVARLVEVFREVRRVLKDDGTFWLNIGDSYAANRTYQVSPTKWKGLPQGQASKVPEGLKAKDLLMIPARVALALQADGWYLRSEIVWAKPNPMPESVRDRPTCSHEKVFLFAKAPRYYYDADAIREPAAIQLDGPDRYTRLTGRSHAAGSRRDQSRVTSIGFGANPAGRNCRNVWTIAPKPFKGAHFAVMPEELAKRCIKAGSRIGDTVFDPFSGSGTTAKMALLTGRRFIGCDISAEYVEIARRRVDAARQELGLFAAE